MSILITGFKPFGGAETNPTELLANHYKGQTLPVVRGLAFETLLEAFERVNPTAILMLGQASCTDHIRLERIAINLDDYPIPDNAGNQPKEEKIIIDAPDAYFSTLPLRTIFDELQKHGIPVELSLSAGSYLCNHLFFQVMHFVKGLKRNIPSGFIHVPPMMERKTMIQAIDIAIQNINQII